MSTYTQSLIQIVFSTKYREKTLIKPNREELFRYITGVLHNNNCHVYRIGGIEDHIHIATHIHPCVSVANLVKDIKLASSYHIKTQGLFPHFGGWQVGYAWFTYSFRDKDRLIQYVKNQETHHHEKDCITELMELLKEHEVEFDEKYLE